MRVLMARGSDCGSLGRHHSMFFIRGGCFIVMSRTMNTTGNGMGLRCRLYRNGIGVSPGAVAVASSFKNGDGIGLRYFTPGNAALRARRK